MDAPGHDFFEVLPASGAREPPGAPRGLAQDAPKLSRKRTKIRTRKWSKKGAQRVAQGDPKRGPKRPRS